VALPKGARTARLMCAQRQETRSGAPLKLCRTSYDKPSRDGTVQACSDGRQVESGDTRTAYRQATLFFSIATGGNLPVGA
jgi:hypothetical protein